MVCPPSRGTWGPRAAQMDGAGVRRATALDAQTQPGPAPGGRGSARGRRGHGACPTQGPPQRAVPGPEWVWMSVTADLPLPHPEAPRFDSCKVVSAQRTLTRAKASQTRGVRQRPILTAPVKCLVRSTYRPRASAPKTPNAMKRAPQRPANSWRRRGGGGALSSGLQEEALILRTYAVTGGPTAGSLSGA